MDDGVVRGRFGGSSSFGTVVTTGRREEDGLFFIDAGLFVVWFFGKWKRMNNDANRIDVVVL